MIIKQFRFSSTHVTIIYPFIDSQEMLDAIGHAANHSKICSVIVENMPVMARIIGENSFDLYLHAVYKRSMKDSEYSVRESAIVATKKLVELFGSEWARNNIIQSVLDIAKDTNYEIRK